MTRKTLTMSHAGRLRIAALCITLAAALPAQVGAQPLRERVDIELAGVGAQGENSERVLLRVEDEPTGRMVPLLPYIFFDEGSSEIPARYLYADSAATNDRFIRHYYAIIDTVARRLRENPRERLTITGTSSMRGRDRRADLARRRAMALADRLVSVHGIDRSRLIMRARGLPDEASNNAHLEGQAENRRVELSGSDIVLAPLVIGDTLMRVSSTGVRIMPPTSLPYGVAEWLIELRHDGGLFRRLHGTTTLSELFSETFVESELRRFARSPTGIDVTMRIVTAYGDTVVVPARTIPFEVERTRRALSAREGRAQDRESIILFGFDSAELRKDSKTILLDLIARIPSSSPLRVTGYTDETGDSIRNRALSQARAEAVRDALPGRVSSARGGGESGGHHWNSRPEDRFYSRTARIAVE